MSNAPLLHDRFRVVPEQDFTSEEGNTVRLSLIEPARPVTYASLPEAELESLAQRALSSTGASGAAVALGTSSEMYCRASAGSLAPPVGTRLTPDSGLTGQCLRTGEVLLCADTEEDARVDPLACRSAGIRSVLVLPLRRHGALLGILEVLSGTPCFFTRLHSDALGALADAYFQPPAPGAPAAEDVPTAPETASPPATHFHFTFGQHSGKRRAWPRPAFVAVLLVAGTFGYGHHLKSSAKAGEPPPRRAAQQTAEGTAPAQVADTPTTPSGAVDVLRAGVNQVGRLIQGTVSSEDLERVRVNAAAGDAAAQYELAARYANGAGLPQDYFAAMAWFEKAAKKRNPSAEWKLGLGYLKGIGVRQDDVKAAEWVKRAANHDHLGAQRLLGELYFEGRGSPPDYVRACTWAGIAAATSGDRTQLDQIQGVMTQAQITDAEQRMSMWWKQHSIGSARPPGRSRTTGG